MVRLHHPPPPAKARRDLRIRRSGPPRKPGVGYPTSSRALPPRDKSHGRMTDQLPAGPAARGCPRAVRIPAGDPFRMAGLPVLGAGRGGSRTRMVGLAAPGGAGLPGERPVPRRRGPSWAGVRPAGPCRLVTVGPAYRGRGWSAWQSLSAVAWEPARQAIAGSMAGPARPPQRHGGDGRQARWSEFCLPSAHDAGHRRSNVISGAACYVDYSASPLCGQLHDGTQPDMPMCGWLRQATQRTPTCRVRADSA